MTIINENFKTTINSYNYRLKCSMGMPGTRFTSWDIVEVVDPFYFEWDVPCSL